MTASSAQFVTALTAIASTLLCAGVLFPLMRVIHLSRSPAIRIIALVFSVAVVVVVPVALLEGALLVWNRTSGTARAMVDPGWLMKIAPGAIALIIAWTLNMRRERRAGGRSTG